VPGNVLGPVLGNGLGSVPGKIPDSASCTIRGTAFAANGRLVAVDATGTSERKARSSWPRQSGIGRPAAWVRPVSARETKNTSCDHRRISTILLLL